jgi:hypothetical protein
MRAHTQSERDREIANAERHKKNLWRREAEKKKKPGKLTSAGMLIAFGLASFRVRRFLKREKKSRVQKLDYVAGRRTVAQKKKKNK